MPRHGGPEEGPGRPRRCPTAPREGPLTWRVISDLIFCMMAPPPPRLRSAAAQEAGARRSHVGRHLTAPARGTLGAVVPGCRPDYKSRQRRGQGGPWSCGCPDRSARGERGGPWGCGCPRHSARRGAGRALGLWVSRSLRPARSGAGRGQAVRVGV